MTVSHFFNSSWWTRPNLWAKYYKSGLGFEAGSIYCSGQIPKSSSSPKTKPNIPIAMKSQAPPSQPSSPYHSYASGRTDSNVIDIVAALEYLHFNRWMLVLNAVPPLYCIYVLPMQFWITKIQKEFWSCQLYNISSCFIC